MLEIKYNLKDLMYCHLTLGYIQDDKIIFQVKYNKCAEYEEKYIEYDYKKLTYQNVDNMEYEFIKNCPIKKLTPQGTPPNLLLPLVNRYCVIFIHDGYDGTFIFDRETEKVVKTIKKVEYISADYKHYYDSDLKNICSLDGQVIIQNVGHIFKKIGNSLCYGSTFIYDKILIMIVRDYQRYIEMYSPWHRSLSYLFLNQSLHESMIASLICNNQNKNTNMHIPKYVLLHIFDLF
jgi:hypothetical protein